MKAVILAAIVAAGTLASSFAARSADADGVVRAREPAASSEARAAAAADKVRETAPARKALPPATTVTVFGTVVDEADVPVADVRVSVMKWDGTSTGRTAEQGQFQVEVDKSRLRGSLVTAGDDNGRRQGSALIGWELNEDTPPPGLRIVLKKARAIPVTVADKNGKLMTGARVFAIQSFKITAAATTDEKGAAVLLCPADHPLETIFARSPGAGVDYFLFNSGAGPANDPYRLPQDETGPVAFRLGEGRTVQVRVVDDHSKPIAGANVYPWLFELPKKGGQFNTGGAFVTTAGADGLATFDMVPAGNVSKITFWARAEGYFAPERHVYDPVAGEEQLTAVLVPLIPVRGTVKFADGRPAAEAAVSAVGAGYQFDGFRGTTKCAEDGTFEIGVQSDEYCVFVAASGRFASPAAMRVVRAGQAVEPVELVLQPATRVHGRVTVGQARRPQPGRYITLYQKDGYNYNDLPEQARLPQPKGNRRAIVPVLTQNAKTDEAGRFEFFAGPGKYYIIGPDAAKPPEFSLNGEAEYEVDLHAERPDTGEIAGQVVLAGNPELGISTAVVSGAATQSRARRLELVTDKSGRFRSTRGLSDMFVHASAEEGLLSGIVEISADDTEVVIPVRPSAAARGRLIDKNTGHPLADQELQFGMRVNHEGGAFSSHFGGSTTTNALGEFTLGGLTVGRAFELNMVIERSPEGWAQSSRTVGSVTAETSDKVDMGDLKVEPRNSATLEDRIRFSMPLKPLAPDRFKTRLREARLAEQRLLVLVAASASDPCRRFFDMYFGEGESPTIIRRALANYSLLALDASTGEQRDALRPLLARLKLPLPAEADALFAVLDFEGKLVATTTARELSSGSELSGPMLFAFLKKHVQPQPDAEQLLAGALAEAKRDDKYVFVLARTPFSASCLLLSRYFERHKDLLAKDYVPVALDARFANGPAVLERVGKAQGEGLPWMAILDSAGKPVLTAVGGGNIGFPMAPGEMARFGNMLRTTARHLTAGELDLLTKSLLDSSQ